MASSQEAFDKEEAYRKEVESIKARYKKNHTNVASEGNDSRQRRELVSWSIQKDLDEDNEQAEALAKKAAVLAEEGTSRLAKSLALAKQTEAIGSDALTQLHGQSEQLDRVNNQLQAVNSNMSTAEKVIHGMENFFVGLFQKGVPASKARSGGPKPSRAAPVSASAAAATNGETPPPETTGPSAATNNRSKSFLSGAFTKSRSTSARLPSGMPPVAPPDDKESRGRSRDSVRRSESSRGGTRDADRDRNLLFGNASARKTGAGSRSGAWAGQGADTGDEAVDQYLGVVEENKAVQDKQLDEISSVVARLKQMGHDMNSELSSQSHKIDTLTDNAKSTQLRVTAGSKRVTKLR